MIRESLAALRDRIPGERTLEGALSAAMDLADAGYWVSLERAPSTDEATDQSLDHCRYLVDALAAGGLESSCEVIVTAEAPTPGLEALVAHASDAGVQITVGAVADVAATVGWASSMAAAGTPVGLILQSAMRRTEADCASLAAQRVRLVKGGHTAGAEAVYSQPLEVDKAFVRCAKTLLKGTGLPSFATRDARLVEIVDAIATRLGRSRDSYEFAVPFGPDPQARVSATGDRIRIWVPYGPGPRAHLMGGLAEQPRTIVAAVRSLLPGM